MTYDKKLFSDTKRKPPFEVEPEPSKEIRESQECVVCHKTIPAGSPAKSMPGKDYKQEGVQTVEFYVSRNYAHYPDCENPIVAELKPESKPQDKQIKLFEK